MHPLPDDPAAFADHVAGLLSRLHPDFDIQRAAPLELLVNGRRLDLENLRRLVGQAPDRGVEIVAQYLDHLFETDPAMAATFPYEIAKEMVMPRIHHTSIFERLNAEMVAHVPYVNDTVVLFVIDLPNMTVSITTEQMVRWGVTADDLDDVARENLLSHSDGLDIRFVESKEGGRAALVTHRDGYDASRLLLPNLYDCLAPEMGGDFLVAAPARDMFLAISRDPGNFVKRMAGRVAENYRTLPYPITERFFFVTRDGVAGGVAA